MPLEFKTVRKMVAIEVTETEVEITKADFQAAMVAYLLDKYVIAAGAYDFQYEPYNEDYARDTDTMGKMVITAKRSN